ncbi:sigma factor [Streptomyces sp900105755]|uniref:RNA polymerase sigma factor n=1 Tax=Streptomyces sp. 900105755 TaxID=3154389 RepID=UPI003324E3D1
MSRETAGTARGEDAVLTRAAQAGEVAALGLLLERHRAGMRAVALSLLGTGPDAEDVVQDAALTALRRIGDVRDPGARWAHGCG